MPVAVDVNPAPTDREDPLEPAPPVGRDPWWSRPVGPVVLVVTLATVITIRASTTYHGQRVFMLFDDAMISMRYARNLADGHGLVFNAGQAPVEGYTNFLWTLWMAALHLLPVPVRWVSALVSASGAALVAATVVLTGRISRLVTARWRDDRERGAMVAALTMWGVALWYPLMWWSVRGLEPGLLAAMLALALWAALRIDGDGPTPALGGALAVALVVGVLTRTDFAVVVPALLVWLGWRRGPPRRAALVVAGIVVVTLVAHTLFRLAYYGELVPNTYVLKIEGIPLWTRLERGLEALGAVTVAELAVLLCFTAVAVVRRRRDRVTWLLVPPIVAAAAYMVSVGGDAWEWTQYSDRFLAPVGPLLFLLAALGVAEVLGMERRRSAAVLGTIGALVVGAIVVANGIRPNGDIVRTPFNLDELRRLHWFALGCALALVLGALLLVLSDGRRRGLPFLALGIAVVVLVGLPSWMEWLRTNGALVGTGKHEVAVGLGLRRAVIRGHHPTIAVVAAGNIPYWSELRTVDVLGKVDPVIAHRPPKPIPFSPGHDKWDYRYSVCRLRPDVVVQLWEPSVREVRSIEHCGYTNVVALSRAGHVVNYYLVRDGQTGFDRDRLRRVIFGSNARARL